METNKKLELLTGIVDEFNLSVNDVVSYWVKSGRLNLDAATGFISGRVFREI